MGTENPYIIVYVLTEKGNTGAIRNEIWFDIKNARLVINKAYLVFIHRYLLEIRENRN